MSEVIEQIDDNLALPNGGGISKKGVQRMNENVRIHHGSSLERQIASAPMTESDRQNALAALEIAEAMVDGCAWVARKFAELVDLLLLKPGVKH